MTIITNPSLIDQFGFKVLQKALELELKGMRRRGRPASVIIRELTSSRTRNKEKLLAEYKVWLNNRETLLGVAPVAH